MLANLPCDHSVRGRERTGQQPPHFLHSSDCRTWEERWGWWLLSARRGCSPVTPDSCQGGEAAREGGHEEAVSVEDRGQCCYVATQLTLWPTSRLSQTPAGTLCHLKCPLECTKQTIALNLTISEFNKTIEQRVATVLLYNLQLNQVNIQLNLFQRILHWRHK